MSLEALSSSMNRMERQARTRGYVEQVALSIGVAEHPEHRQLSLAGVGEAAKGPVKAPTTQLRLAFRR
jgi:hypothetical protein